MQADILGIVSHIVSYDCLFASLVIISFEKFDVENDLRADEVRQCARARDTTANVFLVHNSIALTL